MAGRWVATRDEEIRRRDVIISQLTQLIPEIEAPAAPVQQPSPSESRTEAAHEPAEESARAEPAPGGTESPAGSVRRSWWREFFGFD